MPLDTVNVTGTFNLPDATWYDYAEAVFQLSGYDTDGEVVAPRIVKSVLGSSGALDIDLWANGGGARGTVYSVTVVIYSDASYAREQGRLDFGRIQIDGAGPFDIADLLDLPVLTPGAWYSTITEEEYDEAIAAADSAQASADSAAISEANAIAAAASVGVVRLSSVGVLPTNAASVNDAALIALESSYSGLLIDGERKDIPVSSIPTGNRYKNVFWEIADFEDGITAILPAEDTIKVNKIAMTRDNYYTSWPQDKLTKIKQKGPANANKEEVLFASWNVGEGHGNVNMHTAMTRGTPQKMGPDIEHLFQSIDGGVGVGGSSWSGGEVDNQVILVEREKDNTNTVQDHHLRGRRAYEIRQDQELLVSTTIGDATITVTFIGSGGRDTHGLKVGDSFGFAGASTTVGGVALSGDKTVATVVDDHTITYEHGSSATSSEADTSVTFTRVIFNELAPFAKILVDGGAGYVSLGDALADFDATNWPDQVTEFHGFGRVPAEDTCWIGMHGGAGNASGAWLVKVENVLSGATITAVKQLTTQGVEPTIFHISSDGKVYGAVRSQSSTLYPLRLYVYDTIADTVTTHDFGNNKFATKCIMSGDEWDGKLVAMVNGVRGDTDGTPAGAVNLYCFIWDTLTDFESNGFANAKSYIVGTENWQADTFEGTDTSAVGVGSMVVNEKGVICYLGCDENVNANYDRDGMPDVTMRYIYGLLDREDYEGEWGAWSAQYVSEPPVEPFMYQIAAKVDVGGATFDLDPRNTGPISITTARPSTGTYQIRFVDLDGNSTTLPGAVYFVAAIASGSPEITRVSAPNENGFDIRLFDDTGAAVNADFYLKIEHPPIWNFSLGKE